MLAVVPLIKPYLGMLFPAYLVSLFQQANTGRHRCRGIALLAVCCLPFAAFIGYSVIAAEQSGTISALTWFTTDNPLEIREATNVADAKTAADWLHQSADAVRYHLAYHTVTAPLPWLAWCGLPDWSWPARLFVFVAVGGLMLLGAWHSWRQRDVVSLSYTAAMFAFFVVFACDSSRYFTVLTPMCALLFCRGVVVVCESYRMAALGRPAWLRDQPRKAEGGHPPHKLACGVLLASALLATGLWVRHRTGHVHDPNPFYDDLYAALQVVREDSVIAELQVPYQLREIARLETGKRIRVTQGEIGIGVARLAFHPHEAALQKRYEKFRVHDTAEAINGQAFRPFWSSPTQQVHIETADVQEQP
jgi:hypothetical protein